MINPIYSFSPAARKHAFGHNSRSFPTNFRFDHCILELLMPETRIYRVRGPAPGNKARNKPNKKENGKGIWGHEPRGFLFNGLGDVPRKTRKAERNNLFELIIVRIFVLARIDRG